MIRRTARLLYKERCKILGLCRVGRRSLRDEIIAVHKTMVDVRLVSLEVLIIFYPHTGIREIARKT